MTARADLSNTYRRRDKDICDIYSWFGQRHSHDSVWAERCHCALARRRPTSAALDGYQTLKPREVLPAESRPGANSTARPRALDGY